ncbi:MAG: phosphate ABC transporter ATP-binding protein [candidate division Zixibacteria bacterium]|nr:phosphate ABC transporter ATP-binding protein [candidate division Zixibacteria bacterium]
MLKLELKKVTRKRVVKSGNTLKVMEVLKGIDLSIEPEVICTILGPSGSGKSTLLRLINRLEEASSGSILLDGIDIKELEVLNLRQRVSLVFQVPVMFEGDVKDNLLFGLKIKYESKTVELEKCLELVGLESNFLKRDSAELSIGERQRVSLARTLIHNPKVLLLDEPTSALDPTATLQVEKLIKDLNQKLKLTVIFVTHNLSQAQRLGHKCIVLIDGEKIEEGEAEVVLKNPENLLTQKFIKGELVKEEN